MDAGAQRGDMVRVKRISGHSPARPTLRCHRSSLALWAVVLVALLGLLRYASNEGCWAGQRIPPRKAVSRRGRGRHALHATSAERTRRKPGARRMDDGAFLEMQFKKLYDSLAEVHVDSMTSGALLTQLKAIGMVPAETDEAPEGSREKMRKFVEDLQVMGTKNLSTQEIRELLSKHGAVSWSGASEQAPRAGLKPGQTRIAQPYAVSTADKVAPTVAEDEDEEEEVDPKESQKEAAKVEGQKEAAKVGTEDIAEEEAEVVSDKATKADIKRDSKVATKAKAKEDKKEERKKEEKKEVNEDEKALDTKKVLEEEVKAQAKRDVENAAKAASAITDATAAAKAKALESEVSRALVEKIEEATSGYKIEIASLLSQVARLNQANEELKGKLRASERRVFEAESSKEGVELDLLEETERLDEAVANARSRMADMEAQKAAVQATLEATQAEVEELKAALQQQGVVLSKEKMENARLLKKLRDIGTRKQLRAPLTNVMVPMMSSMDILTELEQKYL